MDLNYSGSLIRMASMTTARARTKLISTMHLMGEKNIIYCDTDSLVVPRSAYLKACKLQPDLFGDKLGQFKEEFSDKVIEADFLAAKCYFLVLDSSKKIVKFKGIKNPTVEKIREIRLNGLGLMEQEQWKRAFGKVFTF